MAMNIAQFYDKLNADTALQQQIMSGTNGNVDALIENAVRLGNSMGYEFTADEARAFGASVSELPDEMLDLVSAGGSINTSGAGT